jgi:hypothetical protein
VAEVVLARAQAAAAEQVLARLARAGLGGREPRERVGDAGGVVGLVRDANGLLGGEEGQGPVVEVVVQEGEGSEGVSECVLGGGV